MEAYPWRVTVRGTVHNGEVRFLTFPRGNHLGSYTGVSEHERALAEYFPLLVAAPRHLEVTPEPTRPATPAR